MLQIPAEVREEIVKMLLHGRSVFETSQMINYLQQLKAVEKEKE